MSSSPYLFSDGNTGVLVSETGECLHAASALGEIMPYLDNVILIWIQSRQGDLKYLPKISAFKTSKCLDALNDNESFSCKQCLHENEIERVHLFCKTAKTKLNRCLYRLRSCRVEKVIPLEVLLFSCCHEDLVASLVWKGVTYTAYWRNRGPELQQFYSEPEDDNLIKSLNLKNRDINIVDLFQVSLAKKAILKLPEYSVKRVYEKPVRFGLPACLGVASVIILLGLLFLHYRRTLLEVQVNSLQMDYSEQVHLHEIYDQDLVAYNQLEEAITLWEKLAYTNYKSKQVLYLIHHLSEIPVQKVQLNSHTDHLCVVWTLVEEESEGRQLFVKKAENTANQLGNSFQVDLVDESRDLSITSNWSIN
jgi:hypothetical protein